MKAPPAQKTILLPLFYKKLLQTDVTTNAIYIDVDLPQAADWGPYLESIVAHTQTESATSNFTWKIGFYWSFDGRKWNPATNPVDLFSAITSNDDAIQTPYTTTAQLGMKLRFVIVVASSNAGAVERGICGCALAFNFKS